eukprot:s59_g79.t3
MNVGSYLHATRKRKDVEGPGVYQVDGSPQKEKLRPVPKIEGIICALCKQELKAAVAAGDGYSYCRQCVLDWFRSHERSNSDITSPITGEPLMDRLLLPNLNLREVIVSVQHAIPAWDEAERERVSLRKKIQRSLGTEKPKEVSPGLTEAQSEATYFQMQAKNEQQEVLRLQMELDRYHTFMEQRDVSGRGGEAKAAELSRLTAELRSSMVEVNRLQDELEKTRRQAKSQAVQLEQEREQRSEIFFREQALRQELARVKDETIGKLTVESTRRTHCRGDSYELREALAQSQGQLMDLQEALLAACPGGSPSASPKSVELPENQLHSELFGMKQSLSKQDAVIADLQTQITALRAQSSYLNQLSELREQRHLETQDEVLRLRGELLSIERRNFVGSELERAAEEATQEAERLERELQKKDQSLKQLVEMKMGMELHGAEALDVVQSKVPALLEQVGSLQQHLKDRGELLSSLASAMGSTEDLQDSDARNFLMVKVRQMKARAEQLFNLASALGSADLHESEVVDFIQTKVQTLQKQLKDRDSLLSVVAFAVADFLDTLGLADLEPPSDDPMQAAQSMIKAMQEKEEVALQLKRIAQAKAKAKAKTSTRPELWGSSSEQSAKRVAVCCVQVRSAIAST